MITLKNLRLRNFLSHESTDISFGPTEKLLIDGNSGSGKSSILESIIWAFYGNGRSGNTALIRRGSNKAAVELTVDKDGSEIMITRTITDNKHSLTISIDGIAHPKTGVRELQDWIESELTGASYMLFVNSIAYLQGGAESFVGQNAAKRKELLLEIIKTIDFDTYYEKTKKKISEVEVEQALAASTHSAADSAIVTAEAYVNKKAGVVALIASLAAEAEKRNIEKASLEKKLEGRTEREQSVAAKEIELAQKKTRLTEINTAITSASSKIESIKELATETPEEQSVLDTDAEQAKKRLDSTREAIANVALVNASRASWLQQKPVDRGFESVITALEKEIEDMGVTNLCPEGDRCPNFEATYIRIMGKREERERIMAAYEQYKTDIKEWQDKFDKMPEIPLGDLQVQEKQYALDVEIVNVRNKKRQDIITAKEQVTELSNTLNTWNSELIVTLAATTTLEKDIFELKKFSDSAEEAAAVLQLNGLMVLLQSNTTAANEAQRELGVIENYEKTLPEELKKKEAAAEKLSVIMKQLQQLLLLKDAFGSKGIRALVIDYIIPELEDKINGILSQMSEFKVILDTQQEKSSGDGNKEGLFITIVNDMGEEMPFENYSGGEKLKIVVAITEALATLQKCGFRLFDETWVGLDETSLESFSKVLDSLLERFPQVVCVSHLTEIKSAFDDKMTIIKHNGVSRIEN